MVFHVLLDNLGDLVIGTVCISGRLYHICFGNLARIAVGDLRDCAIRYSFVREDMSFELGRRDLMPLIQVKLIRALIGYGCAIATTCLDFNQLLDPIDNH